MKRQAAGERDGLLTGEVVEVAVVDERVGRLVERKPHFLTNGLLRPEVVRDEHRVFPDSVEQ